MAPRGLLIALVLAHVALAPAARAASYVVAPAGDDAASGSAEAPWRTIRRAAAAVQPGDVVDVQPGLYVESVPLGVSGTALAPIQFRAAAGTALASPDPAASLSAFDVGSGVGHVVLDGFAAGGGFHETILLRPGAHHIVLRGLELSGNRVGIWIAGASDVTVDACSVHHNDLGVRVLAGSARVTVRDTVSAFNDDGRGCDGDADGFAVEETSAEVTFTDCRAEGNGEDGFDLQGDAMLLSGIESRANGCAGLKLSQNARVENALVVGNQTGVTTTSFFALPVLAEIVSSTIADNRGTQLLLRSPAGAPAGSARVRLRNLIAAGPGKIVEVESAVGLDEDHNLFYRPDTTSAVIVRHLAEGAERRYTGQQVNGGLWAAESGQGAGTLAIDPQFAERETYAVDPASPALDRGEMAGAPAADRHGAPRPFGDGVDLGPDELAVAVANHRPWPDPGPERTIGVGERFRVQATGSVDPDGSPLTYRWDFGDGSAGEAGYFAWHTYATPGDYTLSLAADDGTVSAARSVVLHIVAAATPTATPTPTLVPTASATPADTAT
ncbi:MAG: PKD domain-containing protein, partial [Candidatus Binatia bacterium]